MTQRCRSYNVDTLSQGGIKAVDLYDATMAYLETLEETIAEGKDWRNGEIIQQKLRNSVINGWFELLIIAIKRVGWHVPNHQPNCSS